MKKVRLATIVALAAALVIGAACAKVQESEGDDREVLIRCYKENGDFVKWDDDCADDGLYAIPPGPSPLKTSKGMQTAGPLRPSPARTRR